MNEGRTTAIFAAVAAIVFGLAWWTRPDAISNEQDLEASIVGKPIFTSFTDPSAATSFQIVKFDETLGQRERFEITKDKSSNMWKLPSHDDYPADAAEQVRDATTPLIDLQVLGIQSFDRGDHSLLGVINPDEDVSVAETGVGMLVRVKDAESTVLANLIVGKAVENAENQHYVRVPTEDAVYIVELNTAPFTTDFKKWIKGKLLDVQSFDIAKIGLRDYAVLPMQGGGYGMSRNFNADLNFDASSNKWSIERFGTFSNGQEVETPLAPGERLQESSLNALRDAVQDLEIVGVRRKPSGLAADLKADKSLMENQESLTSLYSQGFFPQERGDEVEIYATGGETLVGTTDGVNYLLRFGETDSSTKASEDDEEGLEEEGELESGGLSRFLLVTAQVDHSKFPVPELKPQPETVEEMLQMERAEAEPEDSPEVAAEEAPLELPDAPVQPKAEEAETAPAAEPKESSEGASEEAASEAAPATEEATPEEAAAAAEETPPAAEAPAPASEPETPAAEATDAPAEPAVDEPAATDPEAEAPAATEEDLNSCGPQEADEDEPEQETVTEASEETPVYDATDDADADEDATPAEPAAAESGEEAAEQPAETEEELEERLAAVREQIGKENQRLLDAHKEGVEKATRKAQELNARFADWYYIVSDSVYKKLKISREQLITTEPAAPAAPGGGAGAGFPGGIPGLPPGLSPQFGN